MRTLVIDQATYTVGYAVVEEHPDMPVSFGVNGKLIQSGRLTTPPGASLVDRLNILREDFTSLITMFNVDEIVAEDTRYNQRNAETSHALAAILHLAKELAAKRGLGFYMQHPMTIKKMITGNGKATKEDVIQSVMNVWGKTRSQILDDNHADALAGAFLWLYQGDDIRAKALIPKAKKGAKK